MRPVLPLVAASLLATTLAASALPLDEPQDSCATVLGAIAVELRLARDLPPGKRSSYFCAKRYSPLLGASRERILRTLGAPDRSADDGGWSYLFAGRYEQIPPGSLELVFRFGGEGVVEAVDCRRTKA